MFNFFQYQVDYQIGKTLVELVELRRTSTALVEEIRVHSAGSYKWVSIDETNIIQLQEWRDEIHFCPYKPSNGKWILTCKNDLDKVIISNI